MVSNGQEIKSIVFCEQYKLIIKSIESATGIKIYEEYDDIMATTASKRLTLSGLSYNEIVESLKDNECLLNYSINKIAKKNKDVEQDGYEPSTLIKSHGYSQGFLLVNLMELIIAKRGSKELEQYLKASRIPDWKTYAKEVLSFIP